MKKLICAQDVEALNKQGGKVLYTDKDTIITPSAKDAAKAMGIEISCECQSASTVCQTSGTNSGGMDSNMIYNVLKAMSEKGMLPGVFDSVCQADKPYKYEDENGCGSVKVVRGNTVKMDVFDTGDPSATAYYQELISKDEAKISAGFLVIDHSKFEWELTYEEIDYVIEGTLTLTVNGKTFTAYPGDVLFVPAGSKVIWGSPDKARVFYATYPANWPDLM